jgi:flagellar basal-body rod modification protein FlgD
MIANTVNPMIHATTGSAAGTGTGTGTGATTGTSGSSSTSSTANASGVTLGGTDFLTLMLAQLKNQDPTSPVDSNVFLTQLSQLSEVQGITQLNTGFTNLSGAITGSQATQASSLLGHTVLVPSSSATLATAGTSVVGAVAVPQTTSGVTVNISDSSKNIVQQINLGAQSTGIANFAWNGTEASGATAPAGTYTISAAVNGLATGTVVSTYVSGTVQSVTMGAGTSGMTVNVAGQGPVPLSNVLQLSN